MTNKLYYGDNLDVLRASVASESVDLVYLDPPFNSNASYNVLFKACEDAALGIFLTLNNPTREMEKEAASAGFYETGGGKF